MSAFIYPPASSSTQQSALRIQPLRRIQRDGWALTAARKCRAPCHYLKLLEVQMSQSSSRMTRRRFALGAAVAATTVFLPGSEASAHELSEASNPPVQQPSSTKLSPDAQAEVEMKVKEIFRKYGKRLNDEQRAD